MKRILVTGGAGFIGSHTCFTLLENNYELFVLDSFVNSEPVALKRVINLLKKNNNGKENLHIINGDLRDIKTIEKVFEETENEKNPISGVIHFAGLKAVSESVENPIKYWDFNLISSINLLKIMDKYNCRTIVFSSSATVYGLNSTATISENNPLNPTNPYGNTKLVIEKLLHDVYISSPESWRIANLRFFNPIGAHESGLIGENANGKPNNIFPYILQVASGNLPYLEIYGKDWPTHDGTGVRDYIHVMDLAEGHSAALNYLFENKPQTININIGTGKGTSVLELVNIFEKTNRVKVPVIFTKPRKGDLGSVIADNSLALEALNWLPKRDLNKMCEDGWRWKNLNPNGF